MELFSLAIITYRHSLGMIKDAIETVLNQDYGKIELIISDDGSENFPAREIEEYIISNKKNNIISFSIIHSKENRGTVRHLNYIIQNVNGEYVVFLAGDDNLYDEKILSNYVRAFEEFAQNTSVLFAQTGMYDSQLKELKEYVSNSYIKKL